MNRLPNGGIKKRSIEVIKGENKIYTHNERIVKGPAFQYYKKTRIILFFCFMVSIFTPLHGQESIEKQQAQEIINKWYQTHKNSSKYQSIRSQLVSIMVRSSGENISNTFLINKLNQGASKAIPPQNLLKTLEDDLKRMYQAKIILTNFKYDEKSASFGQQLQNLSILLQAGLSSDFFDLLSENFNKLSEKKSHQDLVIKDFIALLEAITKIKKNSFLSDKDLAALGAAMTAYGNKKDYEIIAHLFLKARTGRVSEDIIFSIMIDILENNGRIIDLTDQINRRIRNR